MIYTSFLNIHWISTWITYRQILPHELLQNVGNRNEDYVVDMTSRIWAGRSAIWNPVRQEIFFSFPRPISQLWVQPSILLNWYKSSFPRLKRPGGEVSRSPPSEVKNEALSLLFSLIIPPRRWQGKNPTFSLGNTNEKIQHHISQAKAAQ